jgi:hypothetical protein
MSRFRLVPLGQHVLQISRTGSAGYGVAVLGWLPASQKRRLPGSEVTDWFEHQPGNIQRALTCSSANVNGDRGASDSGPSVSTGVQWPVLLQGDLPKILACQILTHCPASSWWNKGWENAYICKPAKAYVGF